MKSNIGGFQSEYFQELFTKEDNSFWFQSRNRIINFCLKKYFPNMTSYLEIGCGTGFVLKSVTKSFPDCEVSGSELYEEGLAYAKQRVPSAKLFQLNAINMTAMNVYDVFGAYDVLEHIVEDELVMRNLYNALRTKGNSGGVITVPQHMFLWSADDNFACHCRRYSQKELRQKLESAGFKVEYMTGFVSLLLPFMMVQRCLLDNKKKRTDGHRLPSWLNSIFQCIMNIEFHLLKSGIRFPFGGSILAVVRK